MALFYWWIAFLKRKGATQQIYDLGPSSHQVKQGTPSLAGVVIVLSLGLGLMMFSVFSIEILWLYTLILAFSVLGLIDDLVSFFKAKNKGLSVRQKFFAQLFLATLFLSFYFYQFETFSPYLFAFYLFILVGSSNACNLTDGLDGLLGGLSIITTIGFLWVFYHFSLLELFNFSLILIGVLSCFLWVNFKPAKIFMGDTGSLALGAGFAGMALLLKLPWLLLPFAAVYILETLSVIIQVLYFKRTGKRFFKMAPLHHHFELLGLSERYVVYLFWIIAAFFVLIGVSQW